MIGGYNMCEANIFISLPSEKNSMKRERFHQSVKFIFLIKTRPNSLVNVFTDDKNMFSILLKETFFAKIVFNLNRNPFEPTRIDFHPNESTFFNVVYHFLNCWMLSHEFKISFKMFENALFCFITILD
jgi:hypothetical protein